MGVSFTALGMGYLLFPIFYLLFSIYDLLFVIYDFRNKHIKINMEAWEPTPPHS